MVTVSDLPRSRTGRRARRRDVLLGRRGPPPRDARATRCAPSSTCSRPTPTRARRGRLPPVIVGRPDHVHGRRPRRRHARARRRHDRRARRHGTATIALPPDLPVGCHELVALDDGETATLVVAPPRMPRDDELAGGAGLFVPTYALWETDVAAALVRPPRRAGRDGAPARRRRPVDAAALRRLPRRPVRPQPVRAGQPAALERGVPRRRLAPGGPDADVRRARSTGAELARRRRRQLLDGGVRPRSVHRRPASTASSPAAPTSPTSPASAPAPATRATPGSPRALVERSHLLAQYLADRQLAAIEGPGRRRARPRPADRQPPGRLRDVGPRRAVRRRHGRSARRLTSSSPRARTGASRRSCPAPAGAAATPCGATSSPAPASTPRCCASTT